MLSKSELAHFRSRTPIALAAVLGISLFGVRPAAAQNTTWTVTVNVNQQPPVFTVTPTPQSGGSGCPTAKQGLSKKGNLYGVCLGDTITWQAVKGVTPAPNDMIVVFSEYGIFDSPGAGDIITGMGSTTPATVISGDPNGTTEYYIGVVDGTTWYTQDPKIIMGSGSTRGPFAEVRELDLLKDEVGLSREEKDRLDAITKELHQELVAIEALEATEKREPKKQN